MNYLQGGNVMDNLWPDMFQNIEIIVVHKGNYNYRYGDFKGELSSWAVSIVPSGIRYNFNISGEGTVTYFSIEPKHFENCINEINSDDIVSVLTNRIPSAFILFNNPSAQLNLKPYLEEFIDLCHCEKQDLIVKQFIKIVNLTCEQYNEKDEFIIVYNSIAHLLGGVYEIINRDVNITLNQAAEELNYSREHVSRTIHKYTGMTFTDIQLEVRLKKAMELLKNTDKDIDEIAVLSGFTSKQYINRIFTRYTGVTPIQYRKIKRQNLSKKD